MLECDVQQKYGIEQGGILYFVFVLVSFSPNKTFHVILHFVIFSSVLP